METLDVIPYTQFASIPNDPTDPAPAVKHFGLLRELTKETVDAIDAPAGPGANGPINIVDIRRLDRAFSRPSAFPNAVGARDAAFAFLSLPAIPPGHRVADYVDSGAILSRR